MRRRWEYIAEICRSLEGTSDVKRAMLWSVLTMLIMVLSVAGGSSVLVAVNRKHQMDVKADGGGWLVELVFAGDLAGEENVNAAYIALRSGVEKALTSSCTVAVATSEGKDDDESDGEK
jgi:hypothetical protein